jgi:hypothetical protein
MMEAFQEAGQWQEDQRIMLFDKDPVNLISEIPDFRIMCKDNFLTFCTML